MRGIGGGLIIGALIAFPLLTMCSPSPPKDDTDPPNGRSGLIIYTDHLTGCQYLTPGIWGGLTPRIDADGMPICRSSKQ